MTEQTLNKFYQVATQRGFSRDYQARIALLRLNGVTLTPEDLVYIKSFSLPSKKTTISSVKYFGVDIHSVGTRDFGDSKNWVLTFHSDQILRLKRWFEDRMEESATNSTGRIPVNPVPNNTGNDALIEVINDSLQTVVTYRLNGLFVVDLPGVNYSLEGAGKVQEFKVTLGYQTWDRIEGNSALDYSGVGKDELPNPSPTSAVVGVPTTQNAAPKAGSRREKVPTPGPGGFLKALGTISQYANAITGTARAVGGTAGALGGVARNVRGLGRAIRGR